MRNKGNAARVCAILLTVCLLFAACAELVPARAAKKGKGGKSAFASKIPVLTYHRVVSERQKRSAKYANDRFSVSVNTFNRQMAWLKKKSYTTISCEQLYLWRMKQINLPRRSVLITFDDGYASTIENVIPILEAYGFRGTAFIIGAASNGSNGSRFITTKRIREIQERYPWFEFQSHSWALHKKSAYKKKKYAAFVSDVTKQNQVFGFEYIAYPYGRFSKAMVKAYFSNGIKMAFVFGDKYNGYATRKQKIYKMHRIEVAADMTLSEFKKWCG